MADNGPLIGRLSRFCDKPRLPRRERIDNGPTGLRRPLHRRRRIIGILYYYATRAPRRGKIQPQQQ